MLGDGLLVHETQTVALGALEMHSFLIGRPTLKEGRVRYRWAARSQPTFRIGGYSHGLVSGRPDSLTGATIICWTDAQLNPEDFKTLHERCLKAFEVYRGEATRTLELLGRCQPEKLTLQEQSDLQSQRLRENDAYARYNGLRTRLFGAARIGYTDSK